MSEYTYPADGAPPSIHHMGAGREANPEIVQWRAGLALSKKLRAAIILRERNRRKEALREKDRA